MIERAGERLENADFVRAFEDMSSRCRQVSGPLFAPKMLAQQSLRVAGHVALALVAADESLGPSVRRGGCRFFDEQPLERPFDGFAFGEFRVGAVLRELLLHARGKADGD